MSGCGGTRDTLCVDINHRGLDWALVLAGCPECNTKARFDCDGSECDIMWR